MKNTYLGLFAATFCLTLAACGSDAKDAKDATGASKCEVPSDADLAVAGFLAASPNACGTQMFAKYKHEGFTAVNAKIAELALAAPTADLGDSFQTKIAQATPARQAEFGQHLLSFLEAAYGSPTPYAGPGMVPAHAGLGITIAQYNYFINQVVVPALTAVGVEANDISNCFAPTVMNAGFVKTVVTCK